MLEQDGELVGRRVVERKKGARTGPVVSPASATGRLHRSRVALAFEELAQRPEARPELTRRRKVDVVDQQAVQLDALRRHYRGRSPDDRPHSGGERGEGERVPAVEEGRPSTASFSPALFDTFAVINRRGAQLSPGVRRLLAELEAHMLAVADDFDRSR